MRVSDDTEEERRLELLHALGVLDTPPEAAFDALVAAAAAVTGCPMAMLSLADRERHWVKARHGLQVTELQRELAFCEATLREPGGGLEVPDTQLDARFAEHPMVLQAPHLRFYIGLPLKVDGLRVGALCALDTRTRELGDEQRRALADLAHAASELLSQRRQQRALHQHSERLYDLARASGDWMWELDDQLRYRWISGDFEAITGLDPAAMMGQPMLDAPRLDARGRLLSRRAGLLAQLQAREPFARVITLCNTPRGSLHLSRSATPVFDADGR
jgi:GAF domain-containing protein